MHWFALLASALLTLYAPGASAYPLDGAERTGMMRLEGYHLVQQGKARGLQLPSGALLDTNQIQLRLLTRPDLQLPEPDPEFTAEVVELLGKNAEEWGIAVLDLSDPDHPVYAEHRADRRFNPGSVGKLVAGIALFKTLAELYPGEFGRLQVLRDTEVVADDFVHYDDHDVPFWNPATKRLYFRPLRVGDRANLWSYLDWMLSASSNAAASTVMEQLMLLRRFGPDYPVSPEQIAVFWHDTPRATLGGLLRTSLNDGLVASGLNVDDFWQGKFFTHYGQRHVPGGRSYATPRELVRFLLHLEQGKVVDPFSSLAIKRLMYMTEKRIRYAASPALNDAALFFKSGSLYSCRAEPGFKCGKYRGNVVNRLNSVATVEWPAGKPRLFYLVGVTSNVLKENASVAHQTLATRLQRLIQRRNPGGGKLEHEVIQRDDDPAQPFAAVTAMGQPHRDVASAVAFDDGAVGMVVTPGAGLAVDVGAGTIGHQSLDELVLDGRLAEHRLHLPGQLR